ncbi:MAG: ferritin-like domain-containing protein [Caldilineaceae bacterium]
MHKKLNPTSLNRRNFLKSSAIALVATSLLGTHLLSTPALAQTAMSDLDILNYALTLEHLESRAYKDVNSLGLLSGRAKDYFIAIGNHEAAHVVALTGAITKLGGTPVRAQEKYNFPTFKTQAEVLTYFQMLEELGAAAYLGQAGNIKDKDLLTAAVGIHNVEGQHAAVLADLTGQAPSPIFAQAKTMEEVLAVVTPLLSSAPTAMPRTGRGENKHAPSLRSAGW